MCRYCRRGGNNVPSDAKTDVSVCKSKSVRAKMLRRLCAFCAFSDGSFRCGIRPFTVWNTVFCSAVRGLLHTGRRPFIPPNGMYVRRPCDYSHDKSLFFLLYSAVFTVPVLIFRHGKQTCFVWQNVACYAVSAYGCANKACWHNGDFRTFYLCYCSLFKCEYQQSDEIHTIPFLIRQDILKKLKPFMDVGI